MVQISWPSPNAHWLGQTAQKGELPPQTVDKEQQLCETQFSWAGNIPRLWTATVNKIKACLKFWELERDMHVWAWELGSLIQREHSGVRNVTLMVLYCLENFLQKMGGNHIVNHAKDCLCETRVACLGIGMAWPTSPGVGRRKGSLPAPKPRL